MRKRKPTTPAQSEVAALSAFIRHLPRRQRYVLILTYVEELTVQEIGMVLHLSPTRVATIHDAAIERVKAFMRRDP